MPVKFVFLLLPHVHLLDLAGPDQAIHEAIDLGADFKLSYCGIKKDAFSSAGLAFKKQQHFPKVRLKPGDYLVIPGASMKYLLSAEFKKNHSLFDWLRSCYKKNINLVSVCTGAFVLGQAGLLNNLSCTTHFKLTQQLQHLYPLANVKENILFIEDQHIYSSAGIASGIDLMLHIIEQLTDSNFAHKLGRELVIYNRREGVSEQQSIFFQARNHIHAGIHKAQDFIVENIHVRHSLYSLAQIACMSERNFTRIFKKETGDTVANYITAIRKEKIKWLAQKPDLSRRQIALRVGLGSEKQLGRIIKK